MVGKIEIVEALGERALLLPSLIAAALAANDRLKMRLSLLQEASARAAEPGRAVTGAPVAAGPIALCLAPLARPRALR